MKYWRKTLDRDKIQLQHYQLVVLKERCKGCNLCIEFCPRQVIHEATEFNSKGYHPVYANSDNNCLDCGLCELICPEFALHVIPVDGEGNHG